MGDYWFVGAQEYELKAGGAVSEGTYTGDWITLSDAEMFDLTVGVSGHSGDDCVVTLESDLEGAEHAIETITIQSTGAQSKPISLGGQPGGSRVRATWTKGASGSTSFDIKLYETRSGLYHAYYG